MDEKLLNNFFTIADLESQIHLLQQIRDFQPSEDEIKTFSGLSNEQLEDRPLVERKMALICRISNFNLKVEILHSITEIKEQCLQVEANIQAALDLCQTLQTNENLHILLHYCLVVGNHLNEGARKTRVDAFSIIDSLPKFIDAKSPHNPDYSLLNYVIELVANQKPDVLNLVEQVDFKGVDYLIGDHALVKSSKATSSGKREGFYMLKAPVDFLTKSSAKAQDYIAKIKEASFAENLDETQTDVAEKEFIQQAQKILQLDCVYQIIRAKDLLSSLEKSYVNLLTQFAEDKCTDPGQLFSVLHAFLGQVSKIRSSFKTATVNGNSEESSNRNGSAVKSAAFLAELSRVTKNMK